MLKRCSRKFWWRWRFSSHRTGASNKVKYEPDIWTQCFSNLLSKSGGLFWFAWST